MKKFELSLSVDYVKHWGVWEAVREIWQNALDFGNYTYTWENGEPNIMKVTSKDVALETESLLLGKSTKSNNEDTIGMYGEGFKLALLVLTRMGKTVTIYNACRNEIWRPKIVKSRKYKAEILTIFVEKHIFPDLYNDDLTFEIVGITNEELEEMNQKNLHMNNRINQLNKIETSYGDILLDKLSDKPVVYVNGLYISKIPVNGYRYSYNIKPKYISLDRDRRCVDGFNFKWLTSEMWSSIFLEKRELVIKMIEKKILDVAYIDSHLSLKKCDIISQEFVRRHGDNSIAVYSDDEYKAVKREHGSLANPVIVNNTYKCILKQSNLYNATINNIPKRSRGVRQKSPYQIISDMCNEIEQNNPSLHALKKICGMSKQWKWKIV